MAQGNWLTNLFSKQGLSKEESMKTNQITTDYHDGAVEFEGSMGGVSDYIVNLDFGYKNHADLIDQYREISRYNEVDYAIDDIVNEMVSFSDEDDMPVELNLAKTEFSDGIRKKIHEKWEKVNKILDLKSTIHNRAKRFYTDGRLTYQKVIDIENPKNGLQKVIELDPVYITKIRKNIYDEERKVIRDSIETYLYDKSQVYTQKNKSYGKHGGEIEKIELDKDSIVYVTSNEYDARTGEVIGWLHKAVKPANQLRMMENALVVYRIVRAPERRAFYVDVTGLPPAKARQYIQKQKNEHKNRMSYDPESGAFRDKRHFMTMQEDYWMARNSQNGKNTEIETLPSGQNLGDIEDVEYFQKRLYKALNIPLSRLENDSMINFGSNSSIERDELKFNKFVSNIRKLFNEMFLDLLKTELILSKIITLDEWNENYYNIQFLYSQDMYLEEQRKNDLMNQRLSTLRDIKDYIGKYYSHKYVRENILKQTDDDIAEMNEQIEQEKKEGLYDEEESGSSWR